MFRKGVHIFHLKSEVGQIRSDDDRTAFVILANFDLLLAAGSFEKHQLRTTATRETPGLLEAQHVLVEIDCLLEIGHPIAGMKEFLDHGV